MELKDIFEKKIKIEAKVISIESLFNNPDRVRETNYQPPYQRNYVWDDEKATYFIESILLGTEIPPLVYFVSSGKTEIVDGRQRYQTILRFINNQFKLRKSGLQKLDNIGIGGKSFKDLDDQIYSNTNLRELFWDTKLRIIIFSFHSQEGITEEVEDMVKKEIFQRYNSGITPLKQTEIAKAKYLDDDLNSYIKEKITKDDLIYKSISEVFHFEKTSIELMMKSIRESLVLHYIPIKYYTVKKQSVISKFYDQLYGDIDEDIANSIYNSLISKVNILLKIRASFLDKGIVYNRLASECFFWALSILEKENISLVKINENEINILTDVCKKYFTKKGNPFEAIRNSFAKEVFYRYQITAKYFSYRYNVDFRIYLETTEEFKHKNKEFKTDAPESISFNELRINKPEPSSIAIVDICRLMERQKFLIRPQYQRDEVIDRKKSSAIIESILLGIKIPPIFVYKRADKISEVLDGQQRLLSILGFIQRPYLDVNNKMMQSNKDGFALNLKTGILSDLNGFTFNDLTSDERKRIEDFDLWIIEINAANNPNFEQIDLFLRLNNKPYPIKNDTFEMWNSYISRDIIDTIKTVYFNYKDWFYIRKNNARMENENLYTSLAYFQYLWNNSLDENQYEYDGIDIYKIGDRINFRVRSKNEISRILQDSTCKEGFLNAIKDLEVCFIRKLMVLLSENTTESSELNRSLDEIITGDNMKRTQQSLYALWFFLFDIPDSSVFDNKISIIEDIRLLFASMVDVSTKEKFLESVSKFKSKYIKKRNFENQSYIPLGCISELYSGIKQNNKQDIDTVSVLFFDEGCCSNLIFPECLKSRAISKSERVKESQILINKDACLYDRIPVFYSDKKIAYSWNYIGVSVNRYDFLIKYIYVILSSRYCYACTFVKSKEFTISKVKDIQVPLIPLSVQSMFSNVVDYYFNSEPNSSISLLFRRFLDVMVYELYFKQEFECNNINIIKYADLFIKLSTEASEAHEQIKKLYALISNVNHPLAINMVKVMNLECVYHIENLKL